MRIFIPILFALVICMTSCNKGLPDLGNNESILFYIVADNDLEECLDATLDNIKKGVTICSNGMEVLAYVDSKSSKPYIVKISKRNGEVTSACVKLYNEMVSTEPQIMKQVLSDMLSLSTSPNHGLVIWSHGNGWIPYYLDNSVTKSIGLDHNTAIDTPVLSSLLSDVCHFDFIVFDACFMNCIETLFDMRYNADYIIASPTTILSSGFPYHRILRHLQRAYSSGYIDVCKQFMEYYNTAPEEFQYASVCCVDCSEIYKVAEFIRNNVDSVFSVDQLQLSEYQSLDASGRNLYFDFYDYYSSIINPDSVHTFNILFDKMVLYKESTYRTCEYIMPDSLVELKFSTYNGVGSYILQQDNLYYNYLSSINQIFHTCER